MILNSLKAAALAAGVATLSAACAGSQPEDPAAPEDKGALALAVSSVCEKPSGRPPAGQAVVEEDLEDDVVLVRYAATPRDAPCETIDIVFRHRGEMMVGEPGRQMEMVWAGDREMGDEPPVAILVGSSAASLRPELRRRGLRVEVSTRPPPSLLAQSGAESRPTFLIADRRIELSRQQTVVLRNFLRRVPRYALSAMPAPSPPRAATTPGPALSPRPAAAPSRSSFARPAVAAAAADDAPPESDPAWGSGWFCVEAQPNRDPSTWDSACHRTLAACEESRAWMGSAKDRVGACDEVASVECYRWRTGAAKGTSCFYRPSHCRRDRERRFVDAVGSGPTSGCYRSE